MTQTQGKNHIKHVLFYLWISPFDRIPIKLEDLFRSLLTDCDALLQLCRKKTHLCHCLVENSSRLWNTHKYLCIIATNRAMNHTREWNAAFDLTSWTEKEPVVDDIKTLHSALSIANVNNARHSWKRKHKRQIKSLTCALWFVPALGNRKCGIPSPAEPWDQWLSGLLC